MNERKGGAAKSREPSLCGPVVKCGLFANAILSGERVDGRAAGASYGRRRAADCASMPCPPAGASRRLIGRLKARQNGGSDCYLIARHAAASEDESAAFVTI